MLDGGKVGNMQITYKDYLKEKFDAVGEIRAEKKRLYEEYNKI